MVRFKKTKHVWGVNEREIQTNAVFVKEMQMSTIQYLPLILKAGKYVIIVD